MRAIASLWFPEMWTMTRREVIVETFYNLWNKIKSNRQHDLKIAYTDLIYKN